MGTAAVTTLGMGDADMKEIASIISMVLSSTKPAVIKTGKNAGSLSKAKYEIAAGVAGKAKNRVKDLLDKFPLYPELDLAFMQKSFQ